MFVGYLTKSFASIRHKYQTIPQSPIKFLLTAITKPEFLCHTRKFANFTFSALETVLTYKLAARGLALTLRPEDVKSLLRLLVYWILNQPQQGEKVWCPFLTDFWDCEQSKDKMFITENEIIKVVDGKIWLWRALNNFHFQIYSSNNSLKLFRSFWLLHVSRAI